MLTVLQKRFIASALTCDTLQSVEQRYRLTVPQLADDAIAFARKIEPMMPRPSIGRIPQKVMAICNEELQGGAS